VSDDTGYLKLAEAIIKGGHKMSIEMEKLESLAEALNELFDYEEGDDEYIEGDDADELVDAILDVCEDISADDKDEFSEDDWETLNLIIKEEVEEEDFPEWYEDPEKKSKKSKKKSKKSKKSKSKDEEADKKDEDEKPKKGKKGKKDKKDKKDEDEKPKKRGRKRSDKIAIVTKKVTRPVALGKAIAEADDLDNLKALVEEADDLYVDQGGKSSYVDMKFITQMFFQILTTIERENPEAMDNIAAVVSKAVEDAE